MAPDPVPAEQDSYASPALTHGAYAKAVINPLAGDLLDVVNAVCQNTPAEDRRFAPARELLAYKLARLQLVSNYLNERHGGSPVGQKGQILKCARLEMDLLASVEKTLAELGLTPASAGKLGLNMARGHTLSEGIDEAKVARKRAEKRLDRAKADVSGTEA